MRNKIAIIGAGMLGALTAIVAKSADVVVVKPDQTKERGIAITPPPIEYISRPEFPDMVTKEHSNSGIDRNQRQYRKLCRQNPWMYRSKKLRKRN